MVHNYNDDSSSLINILINIMNHHLPTGSLSKSPKAPPPEFTPTGAAAEIDDHLNRGRNMDTRTPASQCRFVS